MTPIAELANLLTPEDRALVEVDEAPERQLVPSGRGTSERDVGAGRWGQALLRPEGERET